MPKLVVIGDVHHDWDWVDRIVSQYGHSQRFVFIGDYVDTDRTYLGNHIESCRRLLENINLLGERANWLMGNHDAQYHPVDKMVLGALQCSGRREDFAHHLYKNMPWDKLKIGHAEAGFLFTHAGLAPFARFKECTTPEQYAERLNMDWQQTCQGSAHSYLLAIGSGSGGYDACGGPLWHRPGESTLAHVPQVCGHTRQNEPTLALNGQVPAWRIDCRQTAWIEIDENGGVIKKRME